MTLMTKYFLLGCIVTVMLLSCNSNKNEYLHDEVYLCESATAYSYHLDESCPGLKKCSHAVRKTTREIAIKQGRKFCGWETSDSISGREMR